MQGDASRAAGVAGQEEAGGSAGEGEASEACVWVAPLQQDAGVEAEKHNGSSVMSRNHVSIDVTLQHGTA